MSWKKYFDGRIIIGFRAGFLIGKRLERIKKRLERIETCTWKPMIVSEFGNSWPTGCGAFYTSSFQTYDYLYCPYCGRIITEENK